VRGEGRTDPRREISALLLRKKATIFLGSRAKMFRIEHWRGDLTFACCPQGLSPAIGRRDLLWGEEKGAKRLIVFLIFQGQKGRNSFQWIKGGELKEDGASYFPSEKEGSIIAPEKRNL